MDTLLYENGNFTLNEELNGPLIAVLFSVEAIVALLANLFVLLVTLYNYQVLKQPAVIFLTNVVIGNFMMIVLYMFPIIITAVTGEWIFGEIVEQKKGTCQLFGFIFMTNVFLTLQTVSVISMDRFLYIVKPLIHKRFITTRVAVIVCFCMWILSSLLSTTPFYGLGQYAFSEFSATCVPRWSDHLVFLAYSCGIIIISIVMISIATVWTFCFTRKFVKKLKADTTSHVYDTRMAKIFGVFGAILFVVVLSYVPPPIVISVWVATNEQVEWSAYTFVILHLLFCLNYVLNPVVQAYFRKELKDFIVNICTRKNRPAAVFDSNISSSKTIVRNTVS